MRSPSLQLSDISNRLRGDHPRTELIQESGGPLFDESNTTKVAHLGQESHFDDQPSSVDPSLLLRDQDSSEDQNIVHHYAHPDYMMAHNLANYYYPQSYGPWDRFQTSIYPLPLAHPPSLMTNGGSGVPNSASPLDPTDWSSTLSLINCPDQLASASQLNNLGIPDNAPQVEEATMMPSSSLTSSMPTFKSPSLVDRIQSDFPRTPSPIIQPLDTQQGDLAANNTSKATLKLENDNQSKEKTPHSQQPSYSYIHPPYSYTQPHNLEYTPSVVNYPSTYQHQPHSPRSLPPRPPHNLSSYSNDDLVNGMRSVNITQPHSSSTYVYAPLSIPTSDFTSHYHNPPLDSTIITNSSADLAAHVDFPCIQHGGGYTSQGPVQMTSNTSQQHPMYYMTQERSHYLHPDGPDAMSYHHPSSIAASPHHIPSTFSTNNTPLLWAAMDSRPYESTTITSKLSTNTSQLSPDSSRHHSSQNAPLSANRKLSYSSWPSSLSSYLNQSYQLNNRTLVNAADRVSNHHHHSTTAPHPIDSDSHLIYPLDDHVKVQSKHPIKAALSSTAISTSLSSTLQAGHPDFTQNHYSSLYYADNNPEPDQPASLKYPLSSHSQQHPTTATLRATGCNLIPPSNVSPRQTDPHPPKHSSIQRNLPGSYISSSSQQATSPVNGSSHKSFTTTQLSPPLSPAPQPSTHSSRSGAKSNESHAHGNQSFGASSHHQHNQHHCSKSFQHTPSPSPLLPRSSLLEEFRNSKGTRKFELKDVVAHFVEFSGDQHGSRFIQQKLEISSNHEKQLVFTEIFPSALRLMTDVFGNYVIQKFFEHGTGEQKRSLGDALQGHVLNLSLQMYGCRVIQKALEVISVDQQAKLVRELDGFVLKCIKDQNGNHVIQKVIEQVPPNMVLFVVDTFKGKVCSLATHPYGCRVIQRVLEHNLQTSASADDDDANQAGTRARFDILTELLKETARLVQDQYGNYVVQHVLEHGRQDDKETIINHLEGKFLTLSQHKFASNVIEKCVQYGSYKDRQMILEEIVSDQVVSGSYLLPLELMMKDAYANYVVQKFLEVCDSTQRDLLVLRIKPHLASLKKFTYGKHIIARLEKILGKAL